MVDYPLAQHSWNDPEVITVASYDNQLIATFPLGFIAMGGNNTWSYVTEVVNQLVSLDMSGVIEDGQGVTVSMREAPRAGHFWFRPRDGTRTITFARGPEYFRRLSAPTPGGSLSTRSNSKRSTVQQSRFRVSLIGRDFTCLVSDVDYEYCTACHIIPQSRPDLYQEISAAQYAVPMFTPSAGILLRDDLHHAFDRLELSFFHQDGVYYIHIFNLRLPFAANCHGKALTPERFRGKARDRPDPRYIRWHYNQCIKAGIRGFSYGMDSEV